jgi:hypothetical protein
MAWIPVAIAVAGAVAQGAQRKQAADFNAKVDFQEAQGARATALNQENLVRRQSAELVGREKAAFGSSGAGYGGSSATAVDQSSLNTEMDALNTRYKGAQAAYGYLQQSSIDQSEGNVEAQNGGLMAGAALLKGLGASYTTMPLG